MWEDQLHKLVLPPASDHIFLYESRSNRCGFFLPRFCFPYNEGYLLIMHNQVKLRRQVILHSTLFIQGKGTYNRAFLQEDQSGVRGLAGLEMELPQSGMFAERVVRFIASVIDLYKTKKPHRSGCGFREYYCVQVSSSVWKAGGGFPGITIPR